MSAPAVVAVVGGGASGCLTAAQIARRATIAGRSIQLLLIDPGQPGHGLAYRTEDPRHRHNVPAGSMGAWPADAQHFLRWMRRHIDVAFPANGYAPRMFYGR